MGRDKFENEDLIKWGLPTDIWFHVDGISSAHVYLRLPSNEYNLDNIPKQVFEECLQIVKHNSIEGCKLKEAKVCYTPWENLLKTNDMEVGAIGHKNKKDMRYTRVEKDREMIKVLSKTQVEREVDLEAENLRYHREQMLLKKKAHQELKKKKEAEDAQKKVMLSEKKFDYLEDLGVYGKTNKNNDDDDFM